MSLAFSKKIDILDKEVMNKAQGLCKYWIYNL